MSFKPLHSLLEQQQQQSVVVTGNRRIAPASAKPTPTKPGQKIQLPNGQIITVTDLQEIFQGMYDYETTVHLHGMVIS